MGSRKLSPALSLIATLVLGPFVLLPVGATAAGLSDLLKPGSDSQRILPVDEAFSPLPAIWQNGELSIAIDIAAGCYLYRDRFSVEAIDPANYALGIPDLPRGAAHRDEHFGEVRILRDRLKARFKPRGKNAPLRVRIHYQGCAEDRVCYPPQTRILNVETIR